MSSVNYYIEKLEKLTAKKIHLEDFSKAEKLIDKIRKKLGIKHKMSDGMCGVVSVLLWDALGNPKDLRPVYGFLFGDSKKGLPHVFLYNRKTHEYIDPTADQFLNLGKEIPTHGFLRLDHPENYHYELKDLSDREIEGIKWEHEYDQEWKKKSLKERVFLFKKKEVEYAEELTPEEEEENPYYCIEYEFNSSNRLYQVNFVAEYKKSWNLSFGEKRDYGYALNTSKMTGDNEALSVIGTVFTIVNAFMGTYNEFVSELCITGVGDKRTSVYQKLGPRYIKSEYLNKIKFL